MEVIEYWKSGSDDRPAKSEEYMVFWSSSLSILIPAVASIVSSVAALSEGGIMEFAYRTSFIY